MSVNGCPGVFLLDWQEKYINDHYILGFDEYKEKNDNYKKLIDSAATIITRQSGDIYALHNQLTWSDSIITAQKRLLIISDNQLKTANRKINWTKWERNLLVLGGIILGAKLLL